MEKKGGKKKKTTPSTLEIHGSSRTLNIFLSFIIDSGSGTFGPNSKIRIAAYRSVTYYYKTERPP